MKKLFFTAAILAASVAGVNADTKMPIPTVEEAQANGWEGLWGDYQYGYVMPENYVLVDNEEVTSTCRWARHGTVKATTPYGRSSPFTQA